MSQNILASWQFSTKTDSQSLVIPDGCRDLIIKLSPGRKPHWFISALDVKTRQVEINAGESMQGFRLHPGTRLDEARLLNSVQEQTFARVEEIHNRIDNFCRLNPTVAEALAACNTELRSVSRIAKTLGLSQRSLQRLLSRETGQSPGFWIQLARVRQAARATLGYSTLVDIADLYGFADQAHMTREFRRWLNVTPATLPGNKQIVEQLISPGFG
ncbi:MAG: helix-turn-helix transcriptional regulator [Gammaproteobacteria bacterium]|nr:helix-turn-helix transcriptional regulator [Gammaproteobacteria bacterium]